MSENQPEGPNGGVLRYRVENNSKRIDRIEEWRTIVDEDRTTVKGDLRNLHKDNVEMKEAMDGMRKTLVAFAFTLAGSAVVFAFSVLVATGKL